MKKQLLIGIAAAILALSGCQGGTTEAGKAAAGAETATGPTMAPTLPEPTLPAWTEDDETDLYNAHVDLYNSTLTSIDDALNRYFRYVEFQEEFVHTNDTYFTNSFIENDFKRIEKINNMLANKSERSALDDAFLALDAPLTELMTMLNEIYEYTNMKSYLDDDYAKGAEQHALLWGMLEPYQNIAWTYSDALTTESDRRQMESLEEMKEDGYEILYAVNLTIISAQAIQNELYAQGINDDNMIEMDLTIIEPLYQEFIENVDLVLSYKDNEEQLSKEGLTSFTSLNWSTFVSSMEDTRSSLAKVMDKARRQEPLSQSDRMISMPGNTSLVSFSGGVSAMIDNYNRMIQ